MYWVLTITLSLGFAVNDTVVYERVIDNKRTCDMVLKELRRDGGFIVGQTLYPIVNIKCVETRET